MKTAVVKSRRRAVCLLLCCMLAAFAVEIALPIFQPVAKAQSSNRRRHRRSSNQNRSLDTGSVQLSQLSAKERQIVQIALRRIDNGERPDYPGKWGVPHANREGKLPRAAGLTYKEYYLPKLAGDSGRVGPRRLVVGSDNRAYYTPDHYLTWFRVR